MTRGHEHSRDYFINNDLGKSFQSSARVWTAVAVVSDAAGSTTSEIGIAMYGFQRLLTTVIPSWGPQGPM